MCKVAGYADLRIEANDSQRNDRLGVQVCSHVYQRVGKETRLAVQEALVCWASLDACCVHDNSI